MLDAVKTLLKWTGDNPDRDGLKDTPRRVLKAYGEWFKGYEENPTELLSKTFEEGSKKEKYNLINKGAVVSDGKTFEYLKSFLSK